MQFEASEHMKEKGEKVKKQHENKEEERIPPTKDGSLLPGVKTGSRLWWGGGNNVHAVITPPTASPKDFAQGQRTLCGVLRAKKNQVSELLKKKRSS